MKASFSQLTQFHFILPDIFSNTNVIKKTHSSESFVKVSFAFHEKYMVPILWQPTKWMVVCHAINCASNSIILSIVSKPSWSQTSILNEIHTYLYFCTKNFPNPANWFNSFVRKNEGRLILTRRCSLSIWTHILSCNHVLKQRQFYVCAPSRWWK